MIIHYSAEQAAALLRLSFKSLCKHIHLTNCGNLTIARERLTIFAYHTPIKYNITSVVDLLEDAMSIKEKVLLPTSCHFLVGMEWYAEESWHTFNNHPDAPKERCIYLHTQLNDLNVCYMIFPSHYYRTLQSDDFAPLRSHSGFKALCDRVKALVVTKEE